MKLLKDKEILKKRYLYAFLSIGIILFTVFMVGTFLDAQIAKNIYQEKSWFGYAFDKFGQLAFIIPVNFCIVGILIYLSDKRKDWSVQVFIFKTVYYTLIYAGIGFYLFSPLMSNKEKHIHEVSVDIFNTLMFWMVLIGTIVFYKLNPNFTEQKNFLWKIGLVIIYIIMISLSTEVLKNIFSRPRPIKSVIDGDVPYREWWNITYAYGFGKNKSFPSGHTTSAITILSIALLFKKDDLYYYGVILVAFIFAALVGSSRMVLAKHFLTDITFACIMALSWFLIFENVFLKILNKKLGGDYE
ncbi:phosphatase PAP2 family protein [Mesoplasma tabanidae]|uniref:Phosphatidic acid phosphatase type 2/haloperoxidase domain-containing protein n=1 Tax=Mesoplasma tabanidae TaxID=219745 RepID=A0A2K8P4N9_9MOLU|nr:phosphatase PAP2 family protein [Mesoplasma tabanidae]ATZ21707.1 hypothetical protein MTABA_v1c05090 [Mesoplasma tabanidae]